MTGRMDDVQRLAFLRMMVTGAMNDVRGQLAAFRDARQRTVELEALVRARRRTRRRATRR